MSIILLILASAPVITSGQTFQCTPIRVWDGDGPVWCKEGPRVRLAGVAARETDGTCKANQPCPRATAEQARNSLVRLLGNATGSTAQGHILVSGPTMRCRSTGSAGGKRTGAWCISPKSGDISCALVRTGTALPWKKYWKQHRC